MNISTIIATYNRAEELRRTLVTLVGLKPAEGVTHEIVVICNNCSDNSVDIVCNMLPLFGGRLKCIEESRQGLSQARNRGIKESRYDIVAFLDDDVDVDSNWLQGLSDAYKSGEYAVVGGRAALIYPSRRPDWLGEVDEGYLTRVELGSVPRQAGPDELFGLNLSFRRDWISRVGAFRTDLGRSGSCLLSGEETEILQRIAVAGGKLRYEPAALVMHRVPEDRLSRRWFWSRAYWGHRGEAVRLSAREVTAYTTVRALWWVCLALRGSLVAGAAHGLRSNEFFHQSMQVVSRWGLAVGMVRRWIQRRLLGREKTAMVQQGTVPSV